MLFTVTYRAKDGALREERIEAASRAECVAECRRRGISGITGISGTSGISGDGKRTTARWVAVAVVVAAVAGGAWWWVAHKDAGSEPIPKSKVVRHTPAPKRTEKEQPAAEPKRNSEGGKGQSNDVGVAAQSAADVFNGVQVVSRTAMTNADGTVVERIRTADGKSHRVTTPPKRVFDNASDQLIAMAIHGANGGVGMPPLPMAGSIEEDFRKSLATPIEIRDDDSDEVKLIKMDVMAVREVLKERVAQGMSVRKALEEHQDEVNHMAAYNKEALNMLKEIREKEGAAAADEFLATVNRKLKEIGAVEISAPAKRKREKAKE